MNQPSSPRVTTPAPRPDQTASLPIDSGWRQWVAENRLRNCTAESMIETMVQAGLDRAASRLVLTEIETDPAYLAARRHQQLLRKLESVVGNLQQLWESQPDYERVEKLQMPPREEFVERYVRGCRPVVITDVAQDWPALERWSAQYLKDKFGNLEVEIQAERNADCNFEANKLDHRRKVMLGAFVDQVLSGGATNDYYLTANNEVLRRPEFAPLLNDVGSLPSVCERAQLPYAASFWFGPAGTNTPLHHDTLMLFHTQVVGRKRWRLISPLQTPRVYNYLNVFSPIDLDAPDFHRYPDFSGVRILDVTVEPGETMFLPLGWWHQVSGLDIGLSMSYTNLTLPNKFDYRNPEIANW
jgi:Cupin-like domain